MHTEALTGYIANISQYPLLSLKREKDLAFIINTSENKKDRKEALNELILSNLKLVVHCAFKIFRIYQPFLYDLTIMDLIQAGNIGLIRCAKGFKHDNPAKFSVYACPGIEREMIVLLRENRTIHVPADHFKLLAKIAELEEKYERKLSDAEISKELHVGKRMVEGLKMNHDALGVQNPLLIEHQEDTSVKRVSDALIKKDLKDYLLRKIDELTPFEKRVTLLTFFEDNDTYADVGKKVHRSRERIRVIIGKVLKKLRLKMVQENAMDLLGIDDKKQNADIKKTRELLRFVSNKFKDKTDYVDYRNGSKVYLDRNKFFYRKTLERMS